MEGFDLANDEVEDMQVNENNQNFGYGIEDAANLDADLFLSGSEIESEEVETVDISDTDNDDRADVVFNVGDPNNDEDSDIPSEDVSETTVSEDENALRPMVIPNMVSENSENTEGQGNACDNNQGEAPNNSVGNAGSPMEGSEQSTTFSDSTDELSSSPFSEPAENHDNSVVNGNNDATSQDKIKTDQNAQASNSNSDVSMGNTSQGLTDVQIYGANQLREPYSDVLASIDKEQIKTGVRDIIDNAMNQILRLNELYKHFLEKKNEKSKTELAFQPAESKYQENEEAKAGTECNGLKFLWEVAFGETESLSRFESSTDNAISDNSGEDEVSPANLADGSRTTPETASITNMPMETADSPVESASSPIEDSDGRSTSTVDSDDEESTTTDDDMEPPAKRFKFEDSSEGNQIANASSSVQKQAIKIPKKLQHRRGTVATKMFKNHETTRITRSMSKMMAQNQVL